MKMKIKITEDARKDIQESAKYYNEQQKGLGKKFRQEVEATKKRIADNPKQFPVIGYNENIEIRRALTNRFPFKVFFELLQEFIKIFKVSHTSQDTSKIEK